MVRDPDGANDIQAAGTAALCESQVGPPLRRRNAGFGEDARVLEVSGFGEDGVAVEFTIFFEPELPAKLQEQSRRSED